MEVRMKIDVAPNYVPPKPNPTIRHPQAIASFKDAFDGMLVASTQYAISFDGAGLLGVGKGGDGEDIPISTLQPEALKAATSITPMTPISATPDDPPQVGVDAQTVSAASLLVSGGNAVTIPKPERRMGPVERLHRDWSPIGAATGAVTPGASPAFRGSLAEPSGLVAALLAPPVVATTTGIGLRPMDMPETPEPASAESKPDSEPAAQAAEGAENAVSVIVSETDGDVQIIAAVPDVSDETRRQVREAAQDIARATGVRIGGFSLNGAALIHNPGLYRRTSWRSHL
jgi:hypothetical protein